MVDSMRALSRASPTVPIDPSVSSFSSSSLKAMAVYCEPAMLSCLSSRSFDPFRGRWGLAGVEQVVDLAGEVALEAPNRLQLAVPERGAFRDVGLRLRVHPQAADDGEVQGAVGLPVAAAVEPVPSGLPGRGGQRRDAAEHRERGLAAQPLPGCRRR